MQFPTMNEANQLFVKELTLKNANSSRGENHLSIVFKEIKELIKNAKIQD